tara:strand:+ start:820 stop:1440 length:621 start_codon:yes stop_codon:yes gene_type:complete
MANGTTSFWDYVSDTASYVGDAISDAYNYVTKETSRGSFQNMGRVTGSGGGGGNYSGSFMDYARDVYDAGKDVVRWGGDVIKSDTFKETMKYINKLKEKGAGTPVADIPLPQSTKRGGYRSNPNISGFRPTRRGQGQNIPRSYGMIENIRGDSKITERINTEVSGVGFNPYSSSNVNLSPKASLGSIAVRNPYRSAYGSLTSAKPT